MTLEDDQVRAPEQPSASVPTLPRRFSYAEYVEAISSRSPSGPVSGVRSARSAAFTLLWYEKQAAAALRMDKQFDSLWPGLVERGFDADLDDDELSENPADVEERRDVFEVLAASMATDSYRARELLAEAVKPDGALVHPVAVIKGKLEFPFEELDELKAIVTAATPYTNRDAAAVELLHHAREFINSDGQPCASAAIRSWSEQIISLYERRALLVSGFLAQQARSALLTNRCYQVRRVFGGEYRRALLESSKYDAATPVYLNKEAADLLPAVVAQEVAILGELHPPIDDSDGAPLAIRVLALATSSDEVKATSTVGALRYG
jgi:hypothetical protein